MTGSLLIALAWLAGTAVIAALLFRRNMRTADLRGRQAHRDRPGGPAPAR